MAATDFGAPLAKDLARNALELVGSNPRLALEQADAAVDAALTAGDRAAASMAQRAAALALRECGDLVAAEIRMRRAVRTADRGRADQAAAEARMSLAFILLEGGRVRAALANAHRAAVTLRGLSAARLACQRALILQRTGRFEQALAAYAQALPALRRWGDDLWTARALNNRGLLHVHRGAPAAAEADLTRARDLHSGLGLEKFAADAEWNLGLVAARQGDIPAALARFDQAEATVARLGMPGVLYLFGRGDVLLSAGLIAEARDYAQRAIEGFGAAGQAADLAEARLLLARALLAGDDPQQALSQARAAEAAFTTQDRAGWALFARFIGLRAADLAGLPAREVLSAAESCAAELARAGWRAAELDARLLAAKAAVRLGRLDTSRHQLVQAAAAHRSSSLELRVRAWYAEALLRSAQQQHAGVLAALRAGLALVERQQGAVGATELRVHLAAYGAELAGLGISLAIASNKPRAVLEWAERWRAGSLRLRPVRPPPGDPELADALAEVRRLSAELVQATLTGAVAPSRSAQRAAEQRVTRAARTARGELYRSVGRPPRPAELAAALGQAVLVEFVESAQRVFAVTLRAGRSRLHLLAPAVDVTARIEAAHFALRRLALGFGTSRSLKLARQAADDAGRQLDDLLFDPLRADIGRRRLVMVPTGRLHATPWGLIPSMAERPIQVAPSAAAWLRSTRRTRDMAGTAAGAASDTASAGRIVLVAGPRLAAAEAEVAAVAAHYDDAEVLVGSRASVQAVLSAMDGADIVHIAAHVTLRADNPLFSALELVDGPLTVYDLEQLSVAPRVVILPACQSGVTAVRAGDELLGLVSALLALGTHTVVGTVLPVRDSVAGPFMQSFHGRLRRGEESSAALPGARATADLNDPAVYAAACSFACFGS